MQVVIDIPEKLACEGFERPFTEEEKNVLINAIGNGTQRAIFEKRGNEMNAAELTKLYNELSNRVTDLEIEVRVLKDVNEKMKLIISDMNVDIKQLQYSEVKTHLGSTYGSGVKNESI